MTRRAYTLIEVLLALGLIAMLSGAAYTFFWQLLGARTRLVGDARTHAAVASLFQRLEDDLTGAIAGDPRLGAGIRGTPTDLRILSRGRWLDAGGAGASGAAGTDGTEGGALAPADAGRGGVAPTDLIASEYAFSPEANELRARRWPITASAPEPPALEPVAGDVRALRFRYFDGREWRDEFDSASAKDLPAAIEVSVWLGPPLPADDRQPASVSRQTPPPTRGEQPDDRRRPRARDADERLGSPDRVRVIVVPDGPGAAWRQSS
ncbi:MAG: prepilin-type N-terminal cleavage/methylation domain-containing protein [Phycisphaerae bacterium]|nr:prepilin-type N-terminal cleavage/methylation domain-containing protein [Phycisphaerae bacterium]